MTWRIVRPYSDPQMQRTAQWVCDMMNASKSTANMIGCSPQAVVAQAALESGWGRHAIGKNIFGIKASAGWTGPVQVRRTAEQRDDGSVYYVDAPFRDYPSFEACVADHFNFLKTNTRYAAAGVFDPDNSKSDQEYFAALKRAGYATDVDYVAKLMSMLASVGSFLKVMVDDDQPAAPVEPDPPRLLMVGLKGEDVRLLQVALGVRPDSDFGPKTREAVMMFQAGHGLVADGIVGEKTRAALRAVVP